MVDVYLVVDLGVRFDSIIYLCFVLVGTYLVFIYFHGSMSYLFPKLDPWVLFGDLFFMFDDLVPWNTLIFMFYDWSFMDEVYMIHLYSWKKITYIFIY